METRDGDGLSAARLEAVPESGGDAVRGDGSLRVADLGRHERDGPLFEAVLHIGDAADRGEEQLVVRELAPAALGAVRRQPRMDEPRVRFKAGDRVEAEAFELAG